MQTTGTDARVVNTAVIERCRFSNLYAIDRDRRDARGSTLESIARSLGAHLLALDTDNRGTVHEASIEIFDALSRGDDRATAQVLVQVYANLHALDEFPTLALTRDQPVTLDPRWGAALAGIVDLALSSRGLPHPHWLRIPVAALPSPWDPWTGGTVLPDAEDVPEQLLTRGGLDRGVGTEASVNPPENRIYRRGQPVTAGQLADRQNTAPTGPTVTQHKTLTRSSVMRGASLPSQRHWRRSRTGHLTG